MAGIDIIFGTVQKGGTKPLLARVRDKNVNLLQQANFGSDVSSSGVCGNPISYSIFLLDDQDEDSRTVIAGHDDIDLDPADVIFDVLQTDDLWTKDAIGYNFKHLPDVCVNDAFTITGRNYLVEYRLSTLENELITPKFRLQCVL